MALDRLLTSVQTITALKALYIESFFNYTNKISKATELSVLNAHAFGIAKMFQKATKDVAIFESQMYPELSSGTYLDNAAKFLGSLDRLTACGSSTFVLVNAASGTTYIPGVTTFSSTQGVSFDVSNAVVVGGNSYAYIPVNSITSGKNTNVDSFTINSCNNPPTGHVNCTNEYDAIGGRDAENDEDFKIRISTFAQFAAKQTFENILVHCQDLDPDIISVKKAGYAGGKILISLVTCNGKEFSSDELTFFETQLGGFVSLSDMDDIGGVSGIKLQNIEFYAVGGGNGVDFRVSLNTGYNETDVRKSIQVALTKYFDYRYWSSTTVQWDDLLQIVKSTVGVKYVPDEFFYPAVDESVPSYTLPRVVTFVMRDMGGNILYDNNDAVLPMYSA